MRVAPVRPSIVDVTGGNALRGSERAGEKREMGWGEGLSREMGASA